MVNVVLTEKKLGIILKMLENKREKMHIIVNANPGLSYRRLKKKKKKIDILDGLLIDIVDQLDETTEIPFEPGFFDS